jgi:quercetin dioxygenase-like cupin family protein
MVENKLFPDWKGIVIYAEDSLKPQALVVDGDQKAVIAGLQAGKSVPPHKEGLAVFHFLEGTGNVSIDDQSFDVQTGATIVIPKGAVRGIEAVTRLAFLAVRLS